MQHRPGARRPRPADPPCPGGPGVRLRRRCAPASSQPTAAATAPSEIGAARLGLDQRRAQLGEQAHLVVDRAGVAQHGVFLARLGAAEHAADGAVEQGDAVVGQACRGVQHRRDQSRAAAERRQRPQVLGGEAAALARELAQPLRVDAFGAGRIEADRAQAGELLDDAREGAVTRRARRLAGPGQHAHRGALLGLRAAHRALSACVGCQCAGELDGDVALGQHQRRRRPGARRRTDRAR